jgi:succinyl-CoA synthetase beta subunit
VGAAARALAALRRTKPRHVPRPALELADGVRDLIDGMDEFVTESGGRRLLSLAQVPQPRAHLVDGRKAAERAAAEFDAPVVLKIQSAQVLHKSDHGGVVLGVTPERIADTVEELLARFADTGPVGVLVQEMAPEGLEFIVGVTMSEGGIPLVTVGLGGTTTELFRDTATTFAPIDPDRARKLILQTRSSALLTGFRGEPVHDLDALAGVVARVSRLAIAIGPRLRELELNPIRVSHDPQRPVLALDFLMHLTPKENI